MGKEAFKKDGHTCILVRLSPGGLFLSVKWNSGEVPSRDRLQGFEAPELTPGERGRWWSLLCLVPITQSRAGSGFHLEEPLFPQQTHCEAWVPE